jgi:carbonic anhydrase/acetyltransferase-like protein (isoleucine patch superfamily)
LHRLEIVATVGGELRQTRTRRIDASIQGGRRLFLRPLVICFAAALALVVAPAALADPGGGGGDGDGAGACPFPLNEVNRPVAPPFAPSETATFTDPSAEVRNENRVRVAQKDYIAPFARLVAGGQNGEICIESEANIQDNTVLEASGAPIHVGRHAIVAHGGSIHARGTEASIAARDACDAIPEPGSLRELGVEALDAALAGAHAEFDCDEVPAFIGFNALNLGHVEDGAMLGVLARLGRGLTLPSGFVTLPGVDIDEQREAEDPTLGKVRLITAGDVVFMEGVLHVNDCLARGYTNMFRAAPPSVFGIGPDPGAFHQCEFNVTSELPVIGGVPTQDPDPNPQIRIIGETYIGDIQGMSDSTSIRADEGEPFVIGFGTSWGSNITLHALESTEDEEVGVTIGDAVSLQARVVIHGGGRLTRTGGFSEEPTTILDGSRVGPDAVVFRSFLGPNTHVGYKAAIVGYDNPAGNERIPPRCVKFQETPPGACAYFVEW